MAERYQAVSAVLVRVFFLNLVVAVAKLVLGYLTGAVSIVSDGFHSLTDCFSNVGALVGVRVARKPPDHDHPYGHRKYETIAAAAIAGFLMVVMIEIVEAAWHGSTPGPALTVSPMAFAVMIGDHRRQPAGDAGTSGARACGCAAKCCWPTRCTRKATCGRR